MRRSREWITLGFLITAVAVAGCGDDPFGPPNRPRPSVTVQPVESARTIFLITPVAPVGDIVGWATEGQLEANKNQVIFRIMGPAPGETSAIQGEVVRRAIADGASGLIVFPGDSPDLGKALAEAEAKGVPVILVSRSIPAPEGSKPFPVIEHPPFDEWATKVVAATIDDLKKAGRPAEGTVLVLADRQPDRTSALRVAAYKKAAAAVGFTKIVEVPVDGVDNPAAKKQVLEAIKANPDVAIILADDPETILAASQVREDLKAIPLFFIGGSLEYGITRIPIPFTTVSGYVDGRYDDMGKLGVQAILSKLKGEPVADRIVLTPVFHRVLDSGKKPASAEGAVRSTPVPRKDLDPKIGNPADPPTKGDAPKP